MVRPTPPSRRLVAQRVRNLIIDSLEILAEGRPAIAVVGVGDYFELFFDLVDDRRPGWLDLETLTPDEATGLRRVHDLLSQVARETRSMPDDEFVSSAWPDVIAPVAAAVLGEMRARGRFDDEVEEDEPGSPRQE